MNKSHELLKESPYKFHYWSETGTLKPVKKAFY